MKRIYLLIVLTVFSFSLVNAQTENKNVLKFFPTSVAFGKATLGYERVLSSNKSLTLYVGIPTGIDPVKYMPEMTEDFINLRSGKISGLFLMSGYRFNFSKKGAPVGFYIEPYIKHESYTMDFNTDFTLDDEVYPANFYGEYSGFGGGIQMGVQYIIANFITLDFSFLGIEAKSADALLTVTDKEGLVDIDELYDEIVNNFSDIPIIGESFEFEKGSDYVTSKVTNFILPGARFAFSIGIAF
ncbi:MAG: hypothetical protein J7J72_00805 [Bacteroidales bacterium]|nr:hypothetical protein [Bacteroidales bacterium]